MIKNAFIGGMRNLLRSFWLSVTAISVLTASLFLVAFFAFITTSVGFYLRTFDQSIAITAFFNEDVAEDTINVMIDDLRQLPEVGEVEFQNREEVQTGFSEQGLGETVDNLKANNLDVGLENITVIPESAEVYNDVLNVVQSEKYADIVNDVSGSNGFADTLRRYHFYINLGGTVIVIACALVSILVMVNIIRITIYQRKGEIEIMRLVGATNGYIRGPFVVEGLYYNVIASVLVGAAFLLMIQLALPYITDYFDIQTTKNTNALLYQMYFSLGVTILSGIVIGMITTYAATRRHLKL